MSAKGTLWRICSSAANAVSTMSSMGYSVARKTGSVTAGIAVGVVGGAIEGVTGWFMQGAAIVRACSGRTGYGHVQDETPPAEQTPETTNVGCCRKTASVLLQLLYTSFESGKNLCDRYFLLEAVFMAFGFAVSSPAFLSILFSSFVVQQIFKSVVETGETNEAIAEKIGKNDRVFYAGLFKRCCNPTAVKAFKVIGSAEHTINDDLASLVGVSPELVQLLIKNPAFGWLGPVLLVVLGILVYRQTEFFEGEHAEVNIAKCIRPKNSEEEKELTEKQRKILENAGKAPELSKKEIQFLRFGFKYIMTPIHGAVTGVPPYLLAIRLMEAAGLPSTVRYGLASALGLIVTGAASYSSFLSENDEAQKKLNDAQKLAEEKERENEREKEGLNQALLLETQAGSPAAPVLA